MFFIDLCTGLSPSFWPCRRASTSSFHSSCSRALMRESWSWLLGDLAKLTSRTGKATQDWKIANQKLNRFVHCNIYSVKKLSLKKKGIVPSFHADVMLKIGNHPAETIWILLLSIFFYYRFLMSWIFVVTFELIFFFIFFLLILKQIEK